HEELPPDCACPACQGLLEVEMGTIEPEPGWQDAPLSVWRYKAFLPHVQDAPIITLNEGGTPLVPAPRLADELDLGSLHLKVEGQNPTGSFKDRGMTCAVSWALAHGAQVLACASTGNTAASMAAYAGRAGVPGVVLLPAGKVALGKVSQSMAHGARVLEVDGSFDDAMALVLELARKGEAALLNSKNPYRLEGQKTLAMEVIDQARDRLGHAPDRLVYPVGNAGNISAGHKGLTEYQACALLDELPMLTGAQAEGASPIAQAIEHECSAIEPEHAPETLATAIRIGQPVSAIKALRAIRETGGDATSVPDAAITRAQQDLAQREGVFAEPASATSVAGLRELVSEGRVDQGEHVVCVLTGHGLKDPDAASRLGRSPTPVPCELEAILTAIHEGAA
ncbi:MAG: threonine synthase, partial [Candidatus Thermoplasmatota archaeon]|nr:threonine synthase [Candidatus Thermoplasmatota archaeon]